MEVLKKEPSFIIFVPKKETLSFAGYIKKELSEISDTIKRKNQYFAYTHDKKGNGTFQDQKREMYLYIL